MSCGRAIIVSSLPSAMEWVRDGHSGRVVAPRDVDQLAAAMLDYAADPDARRLHGEAALAVARAEAGFEANMSAVDGIYRALVERANTWPEALSLPTLTGTIRP
jgi:glycosyltransferase involved in cell wall biosynthesis